ncbi:MAG: tRNA-intron lyase [Aigarchaeota archaeon]|nr:tRNA-intron lyase [Aigarchaeota archaeon]MDW8092488.1 tRNA-intron lyase [Nitrososphaerota archaeon]
MKIRTHFIEGNVIVLDVEAGRSVFKSGFFGKPLGVPKPKDLEFDEPLVLDLIEARYLVEEGVIEVRRDGRSLSLEELDEEGERSYERFRDLYAVYRDLRRRGFVVTSGIKFGSDFAVYKEGPGLEHAPFIVQVKGREDRISATELVRAGRLATTVRKHFIIAIPDLESGRVDYLIFNWVRF